MRELERFGKFVLKYTGNDNDPDWDSLIHAYKSRNIRSKYYGKAYINFEVARSLGTGAGELLKRSKADDVRYPRQVAQFIMHLLGYSYAEIGRYYGCSKGTVGNSVKRIDLLYNQTQKTKDVIDKLKKQLL